VSDVALLSVACWCCWVLYDRGLHHLTACVATVCSTSARWPPACICSRCRRTVGLSFEVEGPYTWHGQVYDDVDANFHYEGLPASFALLPGKRVEITYEVTPTRRGEARFGAPQVRLRSRWAGASCSRDSAQRKRAGSIRICPDRTLCLAGR